MSNFTLGIETSCDDTSVALLDNEGKVLQLLSANQDEHHAIFGGIVPEIASRNHSYHLMPMIVRILEKAGVDWSQIQNIAVTSEPGLIGSLLVGVVTAKSLAFAKSKNLIGVNHLEGHILAPFLEDSEYKPQFTIETPFVCLAVSGGHTSLYFVEGFRKYQLLGTTVDDAAGEAFDKFAKILGLGYPGGPLVDKMAKNGDPFAYEFPIALKEKTRMDFSFSGLKTAGQLKVDAISSNQLEQSIPDLCASYQYAIVTALLNKSKLAILNAKKKYSNLGFCITGGVSANSYLRTQAQILANEVGVILQIPPLRYCTDNAAMIALAGIMAKKFGFVNTESLRASAKNSLLEFQ